MEDVSIVATESLNLLSLCSRLFNVHNNLAIKQ